MTGQPVPVSISYEESLKRDLKKKQREARISKARSLVLTKQITSAYEILENIRFDFLGDTAFREKITMAKGNLESALSDFLLNQSFHDNNIKKFMNMELKDFEIYQKSPVMTGDQGVQVKPGISTEDYFRGKIQSLTAKLHDIQDERGTYKSYTAEGRKELERQAKEEIIKLSEEMTHHYQLL